MLTTPEDVAAYRGHRFLISVFDGKTHELKGFADKFVRPGESLKWDVAGVSFAADFGGMTRQEVVSFGEVVKEYDAVDYTFQYGRSTSQGAYSIVWPAFRTHRDIVQGKDAVVIEVPIGPASVEPLVEILPQKYDGTAKEIERLLVPSVPRWKFLQLASANWLIHLYQILGPTQRADEWATLLHGDDPRLRIGAAAVLMLSGNQEATTIFCREARPDILAAMPRSEPVLKRMVELIVQQGPLEHFDTGMGLPRPDMRYYLIHAIARKYTKEDLRPYAPQLLGWIDDDNARWGKEWAKELRNAIEGRSGRSPEEPMI